MEILTVSNLQKKYPVYGRFGKLFGPVSYINAISNVNFSLYEGETFGLVGESGSGKTTTGRAILGLAPADGGTAMYKGVDLTKLSNEAYRPLRGDIQMVFQDPFSSLNPRKRVGALLEEPLIIQKRGSQKERQERVFDILQTVGLQPEHYFRYPHEFSGGQRQRIGLARALIMEPKIVICDEPVSALDVSIQAQILNLMRELQRKLKITFLFITHDISVVRYISSRIGVMYLGTIVEDAATDDLFANPVHPYTKALFSAVPELSHSKTGKKRVILKGEIPANTPDFKGCVFHTRCPKAQSQCASEAPPRVLVSEGHYASCHELT